MELKISYKERGSTFAVILIVAATVLLSACDFQDSLLAPESDITSNIEPITIVTDEYGAPYAKGQFTIEFQAGTTQEEVREYARSVGDKIHSFNDKYLWVHIRSDRPVEKVELDWEDPEWSNSAVRDYVLVPLLANEDNNSEQKYLESKTTSSKAFIQKFDDPLVGSQWGLRIIRAPEVWEEYGTGNGAEVGIIDVAWYSPAIPTFNANVPDYVPFHEDLDEENTWVKIDQPLSSEEYGTILDEYCSSLDSYPWVKRLLKGATAYEDCWNRFTTHATHVGGIIAARANERGVIGIAPESRLWPVNSEWGLETPASFAAQIERLSKKNVHVINISMESGMRKGDSKHDEAISRWERILKENRILVVVGAGNDDEIAHLDLFRREVWNAPNGILVGASGGISLINKDVRRWSSNKGESVEIYAPGTSVMSTVPCSGEEVNPCDDSAPILNGYKRKGGTSMAAPHVTGVAALIYSLGKERFGERPTPELVKEAIIEGSRRGGVMIDNEVNEVPRLDAYEAVRYYLRDACPRAKESVSAKVADICSDEKILVNKE